MAKSKQDQFMELYERCHEPFIRYCSALAGSKMDSEDLIQDVLLSAYRQFESIKRKEELLHYLIRAARNRYVTNWKKQSRRKELLEERGDRLLSKGIAPDTLLDIQLLYDALDKLSVQQKTALILFEINGFSMREIAVIQNSTVGAIKMKISRGRKRLRTLLESNIDAKSVHLLFTAAQSIIL